MLEFPSDKLPMEPYNYRLVCGQGIVQLVIGLIFSAYYTTALIKFVTTFRHWHIHKLISLITGVLLITCGICGIIAGRRFHTGKNLSRRLYTLLSAFILSLILTGVALYFIVLAAATTIRRDTHYGADHSWYLAKDIAILSLDIVACIVSLAQAIVCKISWRRLKALRARDSDGQEYLAVNQHMHSV
ncbi:uncharacterized protein LOC129586599 [Paramacrobiotus metropolitanus]|uniref:uncharacterized protein LOC129586599 n=1 Tax=Paramacrobiotus metropolitanus TaxID=2943436 RepID=UPI0024462F7B|nr:uncharacterized protein LOC129586599 [Paramacrobiotus metropolitanus]